MGGDPSKLSKNYSKHEIDNFKKVLIKGSMTPAVYLAIA